MNEDEKINILLVDDKEENLLALEAIIESDDYRLIKAHSGEEALKCLLKNDFAAILLDVQMPGMDGFGTAKIIKAREKTRNIPILFITSNYLDSSHIFTGYSLGAIDYIVKPIDPFILKTKVDGFVSIYKMNRKLMEQATILEQKNRVIEYMAYHDSLTELPNRRYFNKQLNETLQYAKQTNLSFSIMYLDMDKFKYINDTLGHLIGDRVLQETGSRLVRNVREKDFVARTGGDEFNIILPDTNRENALEIAEQILEKINIPFNIDNYQLFITCCIGISVFPYDGEDSIALMKNADAALYRAKEQGSNMYKVFHSGMNIQTFRAFALKNDLRKAIERNELELFYEPRVSLVTGKVTATEALLRWNHPNWGKIPSSEFIPLAEEISLITEIDQWTLRSVCNQLTSWEQAGVSPIPIAINFSAQHYLQKDMVRRIDNILSDTGVNPKWIEIEMTKAAIMKDEANVTRAITQLREMGISVILSNFGLGYTSLSYLRRNPVDKLKIDKSFVHDILDFQSHNGIPLIKTVIEVAQSLDMSVIAEGIETEEQWAILKEFNCQEIQGSFVCPPVLPEDFNEFWIKNNAEGSINKTDKISYLNSERVATKPRRNPINNNPSEDLDINHNEEILQAALIRVKEIHSISVREMDVFTLIVNGLNNRKISEHLFISEHTVKNHITSILQKLGVNDRLQAMAIVYQACLDEGKNQSQLRRKSL